MRNVGQWKILIPDSQGCMNEQVRVVVVVVVQQTILASKACT